MANCVQQDSKDLTNCNQRGIDLSSFTVDTKIIDPYMEGNFACNQRAKNSFYNE